jgi:hypothetical protein
MPQPKKATPQPLLVEAISIIIILPVSYQMRVSWSRQGMNYVNHWFLGMTEAAQSAPGCHGYLKYVNGEF